MVKLTDKVWLIDRHVQICGQDSLEEARLSRMREQREHAEYIDDFADLLMEDGVVGAPARLLRSVSAQILTLAFQAE